MAIYSCEDMSGSALDKPLHFQLIVGNVEEAFYAPIRKGMADAAAQLGLNCFTHPPKAACE